MTAILSTLTPEGFVIGSDGLRRDVHGVEVVQDAQKIFFVRNARSHFAFAWSGTTKFVGDSDGFSFIESLKRAVSLPIPDDDYDAYIQTIMGVVHSDLVAAFGLEPLPAIKVLIPSRGFIARVLLLGYFHVQPFQVQFDFVLENGKIDAPRYKQESLDKLNLFSFPASVYNRLPHHLKYPISIPDAAKMIRGFIQQAIESDDDEECRAVGGLIRLAEVTPKKCSWIE